MDLEVEHSNKHVKQGIRNLGVNVTEPAITRIAKAERSVRGIVDNVDKSLHRAIRSGKPSINSSTADLDELVKELICAMCLTINKTPAQAFTPPANEKKMGTIWIFVHYAVYGSSRGRCRDFLVLKWGGGLNLQIWDLNRAHFQYYRFSACVDANYDIKESIKDIQQTVQ